MLAFASGYWIGAATQDNQIQQSAETLDFTLGNGFSNTWTGSGFRGISTLTPDGCTTSWHNAGGDPIEIGAATPGLQEDNPFQDAVGDADPFN
ncbi:hypothetical protein Poly51_63760 [Rubripirellula tenax]|uniref:Uncharacterized protein n=2 Tax=Rubripirellula tenax TaxID=2528015 RepID=A0A5C6DZQ6_9BACT|nr:hypothetical protein Poly51_63760 [Rubripirellula tenax]